MKQLKMIYLIEFVFNNQVQGEIIENEEIDLMMDNNSMSNHIAELIGEYKEKGANKYRAVTIYRNADTDEHIKTLHGNWIDYGAGL